MTYAFPLVLGAALTGEQGQGPEAAVRVHQIVIGGLALAVVLSIALSQPEGTQRGTALLVVLVAVLVALSLGMRQVWPLWRAAGGVVAAGMLALLLALTGGADSIYQDTIVAVMVVSALTLPLRLVVVNVTAACLAAFSPAAYDPAFDAVWAADLVADLGVWLAVTGAVYLQTWIFHRQADRLRESEQLRLSFLRATSHELRTPLTVVAGLAETLERHGPQLSEAQRQDLAGKMVRNAARLNELITDLLDVDRLSSGLTVPRLGQHELAELVSRVSAEVEVADRQIELDLTPVVAEVDGPKLERVVANLLSNAVRYTPDGGVIRIELAPEGDVISLRVYDQGPGIPPGYEERIFEPFVQGPERQHDASPGAGLGLTLVKEFVHLHGGTVHASTVPGGGSCFEARLPRAAASSAAPAD